MKSLPPRRRFPRKPNLPRELDTEKGQPRWRIWIGRITWFISGGIFAVLLPFLSQGPDAIRKIPEIPGAVSETVNAVWERYQIDRGLTDSWGLSPASNDKDKAPNQPQIRLVLRSTNGRISGELYSPAVRRWTIYDMALIEGVREGPILRLTAFDFIFGKRTRLAELSIRFQEETTDGITDHFPALVESELAASTVWQKRSALPEKFTLRRIAN